MGKRAHGEGTINKRKDGRWEARVSVGYKPDGTPNRKTLYGHTQAEVKAKADKLKQQVSSGTYTNTRFTVADFLERWLSEKRRSIKPTTFENYALCVRRFIIPRIGPIQLDKLTPLQAQGIVSEVQSASGRARAAKCRSVLLNAYNQALRWQLVSRNPVEATEPVKEETREMQLWEIEEAIRFLDVASAHRLYAFFYLSMETGLRRGELMGLRWSDLEGNLLHVKQAIVKAAGKLVLSSPKTPRGVRVVVLSAEMLEVLFLHRQRQETERTKLGTAWPDSLQIYKQQGDKLELVTLANAFIFTSEVGTLLNPDNLKRLRDRLMDEAKAEWFKAATEANDVETMKGLAGGKLMKRVRLQDLRHLHASIAIKSGMDPKMLAERLGHSMASFTLDRYTHIFGSQRAQSAVPLSHWLSSSQRKPN